MILPGHLLTVLPRHSVTLLLREKIISIIEKNIFMKNTSVVGTHSWTGLNILLKYEEEKDVLSRKELNKFQSSSI